MATADSVYNTTTTAEAPAAGSRRWFIVPNPNLDFIRFFVKIAEVLLSFVAFFLEESVNSCTSCSALYFFEFVSCTAFLFTLLFLILLSTPMHQKVGVTCWPKLDFVYSALIAVLLIIASAAFSAHNSGSEMERATVVFGFLAASAFFVDVIVFYRTTGFPFSGTKKQPAVASSGPLTEIEKLNSSNGTN
ncbi:CKLF-like MARVEL transmembrane domain-containing protein 6 [Ictalurus punctatus]|uniref:CKLF-like MARVEL transmembrane domain-containing protein 6 n=1 Tax=Ictalurus punctatus TaxID=7998 RepID=A0A2D0PVB6_ICTPU|nr:CKLF-like MARVEL transmembrane domain-containing protein 6 [Ictalurus punctatus]XP_017309056.1 CKLF-like MARVEL transmembrane domain-containing protein 6 [Ictalurus punctatus]